MQVLTSYNMMVLYNRQIHLSVIIQPTFNIISIILKYSLYNKLTLSANIIYSVLLFFKLRISEIMTVKT